MAGPKTDEVLDNAVWYALHTRQSHFAEAGPCGRAIRFDREVAAFGAVDQLDAEGWAAQAELAGPQGFAVLFRDEVPPPPAGWNEVFRGPTYQLVADELAPAKEVAHVGLAQGDVDEMLELTQLTEPGPFFARTFELGTYVGVRQQGRLVAMAGERLKVPGWTEISAVCTHPDAQSQGLAAALTLWLAQEIRNGGDEAFLHVLEDNENALRLYQALGFRIRRRVDAVAAQWLGT